MKQYFRNMSFTVGWRDATLIIGAKSVSWFGDLMAEIALVLHLQSHGADANTVAALLVANMLPIVALSGVVGRLLDRRDNRTLLLVSSIGQTAACTVLAFTSPTSAILALVALLGAGQAINGATWQALLPAAVGVDQLPRATGRMYAAATIAGLAAAPLGGLLTGRYGARVPLLVDAATFVAVTAAALFIRTRRGAQVSTERQRGGFPIIWHDRLLRPVFLALGLFVLLASAVNVVEVFLVRETLGASTVWYGVAGGAYGLGAFAGALLGGRLRGTPSLARGFLLAAAVLSTGLAAMGAVPSVAWLLPCGFAAGVGNGILNVTLASLIMGRARDEERGRVGALLAGTASGTQLAAFVLAGALAGPFSPREIFVAAGLLGLLVPLALARPVLRAASAPSLGPAAGSSPACRPAVGPTPNRGYPQNSDRRSETRVVASSCADARTHHSAPR